MTLTEAITEALQARPPRIPAVASLSYAKCEIGRCRHELCPGVLVSELLDKPETYRPKDL